MKKIVYLLIISALIMPLTTLYTEASLISDRRYRLEQRREQRQDVKQIKKLLEIHNNFANQHDLKNLSTLYADTYVNNDGFNKKVYFKSIEATWQACKDLTYTTDIIDIEITGDYANVNVIETSIGTVTDTIESMPVTGEIHSISTGIYHLVKINDNWFISGETALSDESSLLYGDARFMNIEILAPAQVSSGETYTSTVKVDTDENTFIMGSIDHDPITYPAGSPKNELRAMPQSQILERVLKANNDNLNEYTIASLAISKAKKASEGNFQIYVAGLACVMRRVNVIPKNNFIKLED